MAHNGADIQHYLAEFERLEAGLPGADLGWLRHRRRAAAARFERLGFPTTKDEAWKYTSLTPLCERPFTAAGQATSGSDSVSKANLPQMRAPLPEASTAARLVFVNGHYAKAQSQCAGLPEGVRVLSLRDALAIAPELLDRHLGQVAERDGHPLRELCAAMWGDGALIHLGRGVTVDKPLQLLFYSMGTAEPLASHCRVLVVAEAGSSATVVEQFVGEGLPYFTNTVSEVVLGANARVGHYKIQEEAIGAVHLASIQVRQQRDSHLDSFSLAVGSALARTEIETVLDDEGAQCDLQGIYAAGGSQVVDHLTFVDHAKPRCHSSEAFRGILGGRAHGIFCGKVLVREQAHQTRATQSNKNLLLCEGAQVDTKPALEILADDVQCSHGATVGRLDQEALFYLRARGIDEAAARKMLTLAFAQEVIDAVKCEQVRGAVVAALSPDYLTALGAEVSHP